MEFLELKNIAERYMEIVNPSSPEKMLRVGRALGLSQGQRVIDFGCGYGEALALWADEFGISGVGIDVRAHACERATRKMAERGFGERIEIVCANAAQYTFEKEAFDTATCIGATFIWGGFQQAIEAMRAAVPEGGKLAIGECYWRQDRVPADHARLQQAIQTERELLDAARAQGFDVEWVVRASHGDWDRYESGNWRGLLRWIEENPDHPERQQVIDHLHASQDEYFCVGREYFGWAIYVLNPVSYPNGSH